MAQIIFEDRKFVNRETGITTEYQYIAIKGGNGKKEYEVQLKNLVQSEKMALSMINDLENPDGLTVETRSATEEEKQAFLNSVDDPDESDFLND